MLKTFVNLMCFLSLAQYAASVSFIKPCKPSDSPCMISSTQSALAKLWPGAPDFNVPPLDPLSIEDVRNDDKDLKLGFRNMKIIGPSKCKILDVSRDLSKSTLNITAECPIHVTGQYDLKGKLIFVEAYGDGDFDISTKRVIVNLQPKLKTIEKAGVKHWKMTSFDYSYDLVEKFNLQFNNLFDGDETRAKPILEIINHSWKEMITEIGDPIIKQLLEQVIKIANKFFQAVPSDQLEIV